MSYVMAMSWREHGDLARCYLRSPGEALSSPLQHLAIHIPRLVVSSVSAVLFIVMKMNQRQRTAYRISFRPLEPRELENLNGTRLSKVKTLAQSNLATASCVRRLASQYTSGPLSCPFPPYPLCLVQTPWLCSSWALAQKATTPPFLSQRSRIRGEPMSLGEACL